MSLEIKDGDVVIVKQTQEAETGDIVVALVNGDDAVCKKLKHYDGMIMLLSVNPKYDPITSNEAPIRIIGKVIENRRTY